MVIGRLKLGPTPEEVSDEDKNISHFVYGIAFLISTILSSGVAAYLAVQSSVDRYIDSNKEVRILELQNDSKKNDHESEELRTLHTQLSELRDSLLAKITKSESTESIEREKSASLEKKITELQLELATKKEKNVR